MHFFRRSALVLLAAGAVLTGACGGNVVVDTETSTGGTGGVSTGSAGSTTGSAGSTTGVGGTTTTGVGGTTTTTITTTTVTTTTTTITTTATGACTDGLDEKLFATTPIFPLEVKCALASPGNLSMVAACLEMNLGMSSGCAACASADLQCAVSHCLNQCIQSQSGQACATCRQANCEAAFVACSGLPHDTGVLTCAGVLGGGPTATPWQRGLAAADFTTAAADAAYTSYDNCACNGSCSGPCGSNYCNGQTAHPGCASCLAGACAMSTVTCKNN